MRRRPPVPHNLPRRKALVGRDALVAEVVRYLRADRPQQPGVLLHGPPGVGKTAVALEVGHRLLRARSRQGRAVAWLSAQPATLTHSGFVETATFVDGLVDVITALCATLDRSDILRALPDQQLQLLFAELGRRRVAIVCDSLDQIADRRVQGFLEAVPHPTIVLATSREQLAFGQPRAVEPLDDATASRLARSLDRATFESLPDADREALLTASAGIPLAIAWALALIAAGNRPHEVVAQLRESRSDLLRFCFDGLWSSLSPDALASLKALALFPAGASSESIALVSGRSPAVAGRALVELRQHALAERSEERATLLALTRAYTLGRAEADEEESRAQRTRWAEDVCAAAARAQLLPRWSEVFHATAARRADIEELLAWGATHAGSPATSRAAVLWASAAYFYFCAGHWDALIRHRDWASRSLLEQGLVGEYVTVVLTWIARIHLLRDEPAKREACFDEAESALAGVDEGERALYQAILDFNRASGGGVGGALKVRVTALEDAIEVFEAHGEEQWEAMARNRLGNVLTGDPDRARKAFEGALSVARRQSDRAWAREMAALSEGNIGILANREGDHSTALGLLRKAEPEIVQAFDSATLAMELAIASYRLGDVKSAVRLGQEARRRARQLEVGVSIAESDRSFEIDVLPSLEMRPHRFKRKAFAVRDKKDRR